MTRSLMTNYKTLLATGAIASLTLFSLPALATPSMTGLGEADSFFNAVIMEEADTKRICRCYCLVHIKGAPRAVAVYATTDAYYNNDRLWDDSTITDAGECVAENNGKCEGYYDKNDDENDDEIAKFTGEVYGCSIVRVSK